MKKQGEGYLFSASDLMRFIGCAHATSLDLANLRGEGPAPRSDSEDAELLQKQGDAHERKHLDRLTAEGKHIIEISRSGDLDLDVEATRAALLNGPDIIYQGAFRSGNWGGWSDFLERVDQPSELGPFSYEVTDTKLKRSVSPKHVLQLVVYSDLLTQVQGVEPSFAHVELGTGTRETLRLTDFSAYARIAKARLERFVASPEPTRPVPCSDCSLCRWADHCESVWKAEDSLFTVANIRSGQVKKLERAGIKTMADLANHDGAVRGMAPSTYDKLRLQAKLQTARKTGNPTFELRPLLPGKGFGLLPEPQEGDVFYDIEGDPHFDGGIEYLHGVWTSGNFTSYWAHDHNAEAQALSELLEFFRKHLADYPQARIYHYAPYEITALRRLSSKYGIGEVFLDRLMRERRFVDLYAVVTGGIVCSEANYSIKSLEVFYGLVREGEVKTAGGSVVAYEKWRETGDDQILREIEQYNRIDCLSTEMLREWLLSIRPEMPWPKPAEDAAAKEQEEDQEIAALRMRLEASGLSAERQTVLFNLAQFHRREAKPAWWAIFESLKKDEDALIDDLDAMGGLVAVGPGEPIKRSIARTYSFPPQETKLKAGNRALIPTENGFDSLSIESIDRRKREITLKIGVARSNLLADSISLHPDTPISTDGIASALEDVIADQCGPKRYRAVDDLLSRTPPRLIGEGPILSGTDLLSGTIAAVSRMDETIIAIQGPPGTGKTFVTARAILALVESGHRVAVASNSHEAIRNVLMGCVEACRDAAIPVPEIVHRVSDGYDGYPEPYPVRLTSSDEDANVNGRIVGGTAFFLTKDMNIQGFDWLFVDEAGQVSLANLVAMGRAARNLVLVGDPRQLPQVIQGSHPQPANLSCLEWMIGDHATIPADRGIFLGFTRRMHPSVNQFISKVVYEGRLKSDPEAARQAITGTPFPENGAFWVPIEHQGNAQIADEEVEAIRTTISDLLKGYWTDREGGTRQLEAKDIIVVAPYNAQVNALRDALPLEVRVGTVDKFQGQEAPICIVSLTASSAEESPRGLEFLLSINRINVAVSRAKALALVFGSPRLREAKCNTVEHMKLVNVICSLPQSSPDTSIRGASK